MMPWKRLLLMILVAGAAEGAQAQAGGSSAPRDVREIFLALPVPASGPGLEDVGARLATRAGRAEALREAEVDTRNGWLQIIFPSPSDSVWAPAEVDLTYFNGPGRRRLVVLGVTPSEPEGPWNVNYAWELEGSTFTPVDILDYLPHLEYADFWDDPRPSDLEKDFFLRMGAFSIELPREGTTARLYVVAPARYLGEPLPLEMAERFSHLQRVGVELRWDRRRGRFAKGRYLDPDEGDEEDHVHRE